MPTLLPTTTWAFRPLGVRAVADLPTFCDQRRDGCCGTPACALAGIWTNDPYLGPPVFIQGHMHSEPACAYWDCTTTLSRSAMATRQAESALRQSPGATS